MAYQMYNPPRVYVNFSASALASSYSLTTDPLATYSSDRSQPIVGNLANYKISVVRACVQGQRNLPLYIPTVETGQPDPYKTTLKLSINATWPTTQPVYTYTAPNPAAKVTYRTVIYDQNGAVFESWDATIDYASSLPPPLINSPPGNTTASWADAVRATYLYAGAYYSAYYSTVQNTQVTAVGNQLQFDLILPAGWSFSVAPNLFPPESYPDHYFTDACPVLGFDYGSQITNPAFSSVSIGDVGVPCRITLPHTCSYTYTPAALASRKSASVTTNLQWIPQTTDAPTPRPPIETQDVTAIAYYMYDYAWFVRIINNAFATAWQDIRTAAAADGVRIISPAPVVSYVPARQSFTLTWSKDIVTQQANGVQATISLGEQLANLVAWPAKYTQAGDATLIWDTSTAVALSENGEALTLTSDYPATGNAWSPISSLVFQSTTLPVRAEITSPISQYGAGNTVASSNANSSQILTDVVPAFSDAADWNANIILYSPTVLRWTDLNDQTGALTTLQFGIAWRNAITGEIIPLTLNPTASFNVKILLQRKDIPV